MLLFNKICSTAEVLRLFHILLNTGRKLNVDKSYKRSFEVPCPGGLLYESKKIFFGVAIIIQRYHVKKIVNKLKVSWQKSLTKKSLLLQLHMAFYNVL